MRSGLQYGSGQADSGVMQDDEKETRDILAEKIRRLYSRTDTENIRRYGCPGMAGSPMAQNRF